MPKASTGATTRNSRIGTTSSSKVKQFMTDVADQELKRHAQREYARDYGMQQDWYDEQLKAKHYMADVTDQELKRRTQREYPRDCPPSAPMRQIAGIE